MKMKKARQILAVLMTSAMLAGSLCTPVLAAKASQAGMEESFQEMQVFESEEAGDSVNSDSMDTTVTEVEQDNASAEAEQDEASAAEEQEEASEADEQDEASAAAVPDDPSAAEEQDDASVAVDCRRPKPRRRPMKRRS